MAVRPTLVLVHSPLVGPLTWRPAAAALRSLGHPVAVPSLAGVVDQGPPYYRRLAARVAEVVARARPAGPIVLVGHSGAGALLPAAAEATDAAVQAAVFVDAILPHPGASWLATAPAELAEQVRALAEAGRLPPWHRWFPAEQVAQLLPDAALRDRFVADLPSLPLGYLEEPAPAAGRWPPPHCGYLRLSEAYDELADEAERRGWATLRHHADHLAPLTRPGEVAAALDRLLPTMAGASPGPAGMAVRPARPGDGEDLARCWLDAGRYYAALQPELFQVPAADGLTAWFEELLARPGSDETAWLVAEVDGRVVGDVHAGRHEPMEGAGRQLLRELGQVRVEVHAIVVEERYRRRGVGTRLLQAVEAWAREHGAAMVTLDTYVDSPLSVPFYERRMGYTRRAVVFHKPLR